MSFKLASKGYKFGSVIAVFRKKGTGIFSCAFFSLCNSGRVLPEKTVIFLFEARQTPATVGQMLSATGPGGVRFGIDIKLQLVAFLAPGGIGLESAAIGHDNSNLVILGVQIFFHFAFILRKSGNVGFQYPGTDSCLDAGDCLSRALYILSAGGRQGSNERFASVIRATG